MTAVKEVQPFSVAYVGDRQQLQQRRKSSTTEAPLTINFPRGISALQDGSSVLSGADLKPKENADDDEFDDAKETTLIPITPPSVATAAAEVKNGGLTVARL